MHKDSLCEKCPNTEYFLVRIFPHSDYSVRMRENTDQKILRIWPLFTQWLSHELERDTRLHTEGIEEITRTKPNVNNTSSLEKIYKWESQLTPKSISNFSSKTIRSHFALWNHYAAIVILSGKNLFRDLERRNWYAVTSVAITL